MKGKISENIIPSTSSVPILASCGSDPSFLAEAFKSDLSAFLSLATSWPAPVSAIEYVSVSFFASILFSKVPDSGAVDSDVFSVAELTSYSALFYWQVNTSIYLYRLIESEVPLQCQLI